MKTVTPPDALTALTDAVTNVPMSGLPLLALGVMFCWMIANAATR